MYVCPPSNVGQPPAVAVGLEISPIPGRSGHRKLGCDPSQHHSTQRLLLYCRLSRTICIQPGWLYCHQGLDGACSRIQPSISIGMRLPLPLSGERSAWGSHGKKKGDIPWVPGTVHRPLWTMHQAAPALHVTLRGPHGCSTSRWVLGGRGGRWWPWLYRCRRSRAG